MNKLIAQGINLTPGGGGSASEFNNLTRISPGSLISTAITLILVLAGIIFFFMLVIGGVQWITSGGDKAKTEGARNQITAALIGLVIVFAAWAIASILGTFFGVNIFNFTLPSVNFAG